MEDTLSSCYTCLSTDRNTWPLKDYSHIYVMLFDRSELAMLNEIHICWECRAVFRKIEQFINKATYAQSILSQEVKNLTSLSTLKSVRNLKTIKINHEQTKLKKENLQSEYEEVAVKIDYDSVLNSSLDLDNLNSNDNILDEHCIKIERNTQVTSDGYYDSKDNDSDILDVKNEPYTKYIGNVYGTYDSEDEMVMDKKTYQKISRIQRRKCKRIKSEAKHSRIKTYICNDSPIKFEDTYKIVPLTEQEEEDWLKIERMDDTFIVNEFKCEKCVVIWKSKKELLRHNSAFHKKISDYKCVYCDAYYHSKFTLSVHQDSRHCKLYVCVFCNTKYHTRKTMYDHYDEKHNNTFQCKECPVSFGKIHLVQEHYKEMHTRFECDYCNKVHPTKLKLTKHIRGNHQILCNLCNQQFVRRSALDYHYATRHKVKEDETTFCVECNKQFTCVMKYRYHIKYSNIHRIQNGQPALIARSVCPICKKDYYSKTIMENHLDYVHLKNYKYTCDICNKHFLNNDKLTKHKKIYHLGQRPPKNKICHICGRGFEVNKILRNHIRTHTGERPFECPHCPSRFSQTAARYLHIKNVHLKNATAFPTKTS